MAFSFGAASAPQAPSFNFGAAAPATSAPMFGSTPTSTPAFGAAASTPTPGFGTAAPAFGAAPAAAGQQPSLFGATPAPTFGGQTPGTGIFGAASSAAPAAFSFANTASPAASAGIFGTSLFGATQQQQQPALGGGFFGTGASTTQMAPATFSAQGPAQPDFSAIRELVALKDAYVPGSEKYRFHWLFLNVVANPAARIKPQSVDDLRWREAMQRCGGPDNPDALWPVLATGFTDLLARKQAQDEAMDEHARRLDALVDAARQLARMQETALHERLEGVKRRHLQLTLGLLGLMRKLDAVESRFGAATGMRQGAAARDATARLQQQLAELEGAVLAPDGLKRRVEELASAARLRGGLPYGAHLLANGDAALEQGSLEHVFSVLQQHTEALNRVKAVLRRDERDLAIMAAEGGKQMQLG